MLKLLPKFQFGGYSYPMSGIDVNHDYLNDLRTLDRDLEIQSKRTKDIMERKIDKPNTLPGAMFYIKTGESKVLPVVGDVIGTALEFVPGFGKFMASGNLAYDLGTYKGDYNSTKDVVLDIPSFFYDRFYKKLRGLKRRKFNLEKNGKGPTKINPKWRNTFIQTSGLGAAGLVDALEDAHIIDLDIENIPWIKLPQIERGPHYTLPDVVIKAPKKKK